MKYFCGILFLTFSFFAGHSQNHPIGSWTDHLSYQEGRSVTYDGSKVYCGTKTAIFSYNLTDNSLQRYTPINMLSDIGIQKLAFNTFNQVLCIFYENGNIDFYNDGQTTNLAFIKNANSIADKQLNSVYFDNEFAFLSYNFGIVKLNTAKKEITETYKLGKVGSDIEVNASCMFNGKIYAATKDGLYSAKLNSNLLDFNSWEEENIMGLKNLKNVFVFNDTLYVHIRDTSTKIFKKVTNSWIAENSLLNGEKIHHIIPDEDYLSIAYDNSIIKYDVHYTTVLQTHGYFYELKDFVEVAENHYFVADTYSSLSEYNNGHFVQKIKPNGPSQDNAFDMIAIDGNTWAVRGAYTSYFGSSYNYPEVYHFNGSSWNTFNPTTHSIFEGKFDMLSVAANPKDPTNIIVGSWGRGVIEFQNNIPVKEYNTSNSTLEAHSVDSTWVGSGGAAFDEEGNLWITNSNTPNSLSVKKIDGNWKKFDFTGMVLGTTAVGEVVITESGHKWVMLPRDNAIVVLDDNGTIDNTKDDRKLKLTSSKSSGNIPGIGGLNMALDKNGDMWLGNDNGISVFYNADNIFENYTNGAQKILIDDGENVEVLLESVVVKDIKIDGANRKWIATEGSGVYLISANGSDEIHHFNTSNSPLFSDNVNTLALDDKTGAVFMGTAKGIIAYRGESSEGRENFSQLNIFPNPVKPDYTGPIAINGLMSNSVVKITDISGTLINELRSLGGQAIWNGTDFSGERAKTGVYLIYNSALDESGTMQTHVGKILFIN